jgi:hypothetical protein
MFFSILESDSSVQYSLMAQKGPYWEHIIVFERAEFNGAKFRIKEI